ncbi:phage neck terminator protein [Morganella morganii]|uniref:phage neck terminator protein n=1 Tax=Morganella morganii TaxID=582 RepID=UPI001F155E81|nr:hypothetical protein [Morganella morganii]
MLTNDLTENEIIDLLADFLEPIIGNCFKSWGNKVPMEQGQFAMLSPLRFIRHTTTKETRLSDATEGLSVVRQYDVQVDIYGDSAGDRAVALETVWASDYAYRKMKLDGRVVPLYASDAKPLPFVDESRQWLERYTITLSMQVHITITVGQDYFADVEFSTVQVNK